MPGKAAEWRQDLDSHRMNSLGEMFKKPKPVIGMVHLPPLPGAVGYTGYPVSEIVDFALKDAATLVENGVDGLMVENMWNIPFAVGMETSPEEMCAQAVAAAEVIKSVSLPVGINVVHNGARVTLGIAIAAGAKFMRICLLTGAAVWDTGEFDHGCARELLSARKLNQAEHIKVFCDVDKKHSVRFPGIDLATHIEWTEFYLADAMIISGRMTGDAPDLEKVKKAKELAKGRPILMGSGMTAENVGDFLKSADGCIVGFGMKDAGHPYRPVNPDKVKRFMDAVEKVR
jgi:membrane complex biogenesis BtpA family protein